MSKYCICAIAAFAWSCDSSGGGSGGSGGTVAVQDCRNQGNECGTGFECQQERDGTWSCLREGDDDRNNNDDDRNNNDDDRNNNDGNNNGGGDDSRCSSNLDCGGSEICVGAKCEPMFDRMYRITVHSAQVSERHAGGGAWDAFGGLPDPFAVIVVDDEVVAVTSTSFDTTMPTWNEFGDARLYRTTNLRFTFRDEDVSEHDLIERIEISDLAGLIRDGGYSGDTTSELVPEMTVSISPR